MKIIFYISTICMLNTILFPDILFRLPGKWKLEQKEIYEIWEFRDSAFYGRSVKVVSGDTILLEELKIFNQENKIYYAAKVEDQNGGRPVLFKLIFQNKNEVSFENEKHDFPKSIRYTFLSDNKMKARISGGEKTILFNFNKILPQ